jgi:hypothetical protein
MSDVEGPTRRPRVVALVAAKDRADTVGATVAALQALAAVDEVLVVDDGSTDATASVAQGAGAWVLRLPANVGKGGAVAAGVGTSSETDVYLLVDADVGVTAGAAEALLEPVLAGRADLVIGILPGAGGKGGFGLVRRLAGAGIRRACGYVAQAPLSGQRAVRGELLRALDLAPRFGLETAFTIDAVRAGARVIELPVAMDHRHTGRGRDGFVHRGRQGVDIARALWVRLTTVRTRMAVIVGALVVALAAMAWSGSRWEADTRASTTNPSKVLLVGIPGLGWDDVGNGTMPNLDRLIEAGGLGAMSVRTGSPHPAVAEGYATLGAGARVKAANGAASDVGSEGPGPVEVAAAADLRRSAGRHLPTLPGALGDALHAAGRTTAVVGVADIAEGLTGPNVPHDRPARFRPAPLALMDRAGRVDAGQVDTDLLMPDGTGPFGERADPDKVAAATVRALAEADVVLVDTGDMTRAEALEELAPPVFADLKRNFALKDTDAILGRVLADVDPSTLVLVVSVVPPDEEWRLTPVVAAGPGVAHGLLASSSTKRLGLVTLTDVAPTVLAAVGAPVPVEMIGHPLRYSTVEPTVGRLARLDRDAAYRERIYFRVAFGFVLAQALVYAFALLVFADRRRAAVTGVGAAGAAAGAAGADDPSPEPAAPAQRRGPIVPAGLRPSPAVAATLLRVAVVAFAAFPLATFLLRAVPFAPALGEGGVAILVALDAAIVALALRHPVGARRHPLSPLAWVMGATVAVLVVDVATGARLQTASILGYSPHTAARFYGLGNSAFAVLAGTTVLVAALHLEQAPRRREALVAVAALFALVLVVDGAPTLGDDVGGILTLAPVFALALVALAGRRITWRTVAVAALATVAVLALAAGVELLRPPEARTHLGRVVADTIHGHGGLGTTIARKAEANLRVFRASVWAWVVPIVAAFVLGLLVWQLRVEDLLPPRSPRRIGVVAAVAAGVLGCAVNDSGIVVTALVLVFVAPFLTLLALSDDRHPGRPVLLEPALDLDPPPPPSQPEPQPTEAR